MNKYFQGGRKREEPDQPHGQAGKISPDKKAITSRHCSAKGSQQKKNKLEVMLKKTPRRSLLRVQLCFALQKATVFYLLWPPAAPLGKPWVIFACSLRSPRVPSPPHAALQACSQQWHFCRWGMCLWIFFCLLTCLSCIKLYRRDRCSLSHELAKPSSAMSQVYLPGGEGREGSM